MNIQQFSSFSLNDILIDPQNYSQDDLLEGEGEESRQEYDEDFEHESNLFSPLNKKQQKQNNENENELTKEYDNTFENSEAYTGFENEGSEHYENTFENDYTNSIIDNISPSKTNIEQFDVKIMLSSPQISEKNSPAILGNISAIKSIENIKTFEDLELMSSSPSSSSSSSSSSRKSHVSNRSNHSSISNIEKNYNRDLSGNLLNSSQPLRTKTTVIPQSSESNYYSESSTLGKIMNPPKLFSRVEIMSNEEKGNIPGLQHKDKYINHRTKKLSPNVSDQNKLSNESNISNEEFQNSKDNISIKLNNYVEPWNITTDDLNTMKKAKELLERIEIQEKFLQDQQIHKLTARKCVVVQNLDLGMSRMSPLSNSKLNSSSISSTSSHDKQSIEVYTPSSNKQNSNNFDIDQKYPSSKSSTNIISNSFGLNDDDGVYPDFQENFYQNKNSHQINNNNNNNNVDGDDNDDDDEYSLASILSNHDENPIISSKKNLIKNNHEIKPSKSSKIYQETKKSLIPKKSDEYLENLAEQTYFNFISDLSTISKSRALNSSLEQLAMQRVISDHIYSYFTQPSFIKLIRNEMINVARENLNSME